MSLRKETYFIDYLASLESEVLEKIVIGHIFLLCQTCKGMKEMIKIANIKIAIKNKKNYRYLDGERLLESLNKLNIWCTVINLRILDCKLGYDRAREIAAALCVNSTLHTLDLGGNHVGDDGMREIAAALRVNSTLQTLNLEYNDVGADGARAIAEALCVNSTLHMLVLGSNDVGSNEENEIRESWGDRVGTLTI